MQNNEKILSGQSVLNFLFFGPPSFSSKPKLGLKVRLQLEGIDLSITMTHKHRKLTVKEMSTIKYESFTQYIEIVSFCVKIQNFIKKTHHPAKNNRFIKLGDKVFTIML